MPKKGSKSTWRDPSLYGGFPPFPSNNAPDQSFSSQSYSSDSTVAANRRDFGGPRKSRIADRDALRGTNNLNYPSSKPEERHDPWDQLSEDEEEQGEDQNMPNTDADQGPKISVLSRSNLKAHEDENVEPKGPVEYRPAISVSDLIELESHHYDDDDVEDDMTAQKNAEDELFDSNDVDASISEGPDARAVDQGPEVDQEAVDYTSDNEDIPHTKQTTRRYSQTLFAHSVADEDQEPETSEAAPSIAVSNGRTSSLASHHPHARTNSTQEISRSRITYAGSVRSGTSRLAPESPAFVRYPQRVHSPSTVLAGRPTYNHAEIPKSHTVSYNPNQLAQQVAHMPVVQTLDLKQLELEEIDWSCENDILAKRPPLGRPNTKPLVFAVSTTRDSRTNQLDMFCVHSHLIRQFWPLMAITAHRNEYIRSDGSFLVDSDSIISKEFGYFVQWLYTRQLVNEDNDPLGGGSLIRLYKFGVREDLPFLRDDVMTALFKYSRKHADWKPTPVLFDKFPSDSMICKFVAVTWANCAKELQGVDINKMIQASTKGPAPIIEFMRMAWAEANTDRENEEKRIRRMPCDFHEHPEVRQEDREDDRNHVLWDWV